jgi:hypothetical protein
MVKVVGVGILSNGYIDVSFGCQDTDGSDDWTFYTLNVEQAEFMLQELTLAITKAKAIQPKPVLPEPNPTDCAPSAS